MEPADDKAHDGALPRAAQNRRRHASTRVEAIDFVRRQLRVCWCLSEHRKEIGNTGNRYRRIEALDQLREQAVGGDEELVRKDERLEKLVRRLDVADEAHESVRRRRLNLVVVKHKRVVVLEARLGDAQVVRRVELRPDVRTCEGGASDTALRSPA